MFTQRYRIIIGWIVIIVVAGSTIGLGIPILAQAQEPDNSLEILSKERLMVNGATENRTDWQAATTQMASAAANMSQDFEGIWPMPPWQVSDNSNADGGQYQWGKRNCHPRTGSFAGWSVGGGANGAALSCLANYPNNVRSWAIYGPFDLSSATSASLTYHLWGRTEGGSGCPLDYLFVGSSTNGTQFSNGTRYCGNWTNGPAGNGYYQRTLNLGSRLGQSRVWIAFLFISDSNITNTGIILDDVTLNVIDPPPTTEWKIYLPISGKNWSPSPPPPTPPIPPLDPSDWPCLYILNWWRNDSPPYQIIRSSYSPPCLMATEVDVDHIIDGIGRQTGYHASVKRQGKPDFDMDVTYIFNSAGGVIGANVIKTYIIGGYQYQMQITKFCPPVGPLTGYKVKVFADPYNGQEVTVGICP